MSKLMWNPSLERVESAEMTRFQRYVEKREGSSFKHYPEFHQFSVSEKEKFWKYLLEFYNVKTSGEVEPANTDNSFETYGWFPKLKLNFAENLLKNGKDDDIALHFVHESGKTKTLTYKELKTEVVRLANSLSAHVGRGDVVACYTPNISETVITMLAATSLGASFTSTSSDFGVQGVCDRFSQSRPKVLITTCCYEYNGKRYSQLDKLKEISQKLDSLEKIVVVDFLGDSKENIDDVSKSIRWDDFLSDETQLDFTQVPFDSPLYIMYSSGTTGKPKCIVHSVGGTLLQHIKELGLHSNLTQEKRILYFTTCGWMMWNWLVSSLYFGSEVFLYEGSPGKPSLKDFFGLVDKYQIHLFGTSPKFLKALEDSGYNKDLELNSLETILSTGAPLVAEQFDFVYEKVKKDVCLSSICGGTDIIGCFMLGNPILPVKRGEIQCLGLGMDVACFDSNGKPVHGHEGELVCLSSFPSRPLYFLNDKDNLRMKSAYFDTYPGVWHHGDFIQITESGGVKVFGRSDATLNPGGVRIGTSEIYRLVEAFDWVEDSVCVGKDINGEVEVALFIKLKEGEGLSEERVTRLKKSIKEGATPRHVPRFVFCVDGIPYTRSGKKMELAVHRLINNRELTNIEAVANPECLKKYSQIVFSL